MALAALIIDDQPTAVQLMSAWLMVAGYEVTRTTDAWSGHMATLSTHPDIVLLNPDAPGLEDPKLRQRLIHDFKAAGQPVILLADTDQTDLTAFHNEFVGAVTLVKPWRRHKLLDLVGLLLCAKTNSYQSPKLLAI